MSKRDKSRRRLHIGDVKIKKFKYLLIEMTVNERSEKYPETKWVSEIYFPEIKFRQDVHK